MVWVGKSLEQAIFGVVIIWVIVLVSLFSFTAAPKILELDTSMAVDFDFNQKAEYTSNIFNASVVQVMSCHDS